jgi:hypothetical protein
MEFPINLTMWQTIVGIALPLAIAMVIQPDWKALTKFWVSFVFCLAASAGDIWFSGGLDIADLPTSLLKIVFLCFTSYVAFWKPSGIGGAIEFNINNRRNVQPDSG